MECDAYNSFCLVVELAWNTKQLIFCLFRLQKLYGRKCRNSLGIFRYMLLLILFLFVLG